MLTKQQLRRIQKPGPVAGGNHRGTGVWSGEKQGTEENGTRLVLSGYGCSAAGWEVGQEVGVSRRGGRLLQALQEVWGLLQVFDHLRALHFPPDSSAGLPHSPGSW